MFETLASMLKINHKKEGGCWLTHYANIPNFELLSSTTNGDSGIAMFNGIKIYFNLCGEKWYIERL